MSLRLFVLRHGETVFTRERRFAGWRDVPLTDAGLRQSEAAAAALSGVGISAVFASPLERARTSAEAVAKPHRLAVRIMPAFRELGFGAWEGRTRAEVEAAEPALYDVWRTAPDRFTAPGGESLPAVAKRVAEGIETLRADHDGESVVLVTLSVVIRLIVLAVLGLGPASLMSFDVSHDVRS